VYDEHCVLDWNYRGRCKLSNLTFVYYQNGVEYPLWWFPISFENLTYIFDECDILHEGHERRLKTETFMKTGSYSLFQKGRSRDVTYTHPWSTLLLLKAKAEKREHKCTEAILQLYLVSSNQRP